MGYEGSNKRLCSCDKLVCVIGVLLMFNMLCNIVFSVVMQWAVSRWGKQLRLEMKMSRVVTSIEVGTLAPQTTFIILWQAQVRFTRAIPRFGNRIGPVFSCRRNGNATPGWHFPLYLISPCHTESWRFFLKAIEPNGILWSPSLILLAGCSWSIYRMLLEDCAEKET